MLRPPPVRAPTAPGHPYQTQPPLQFDARRGAAPLTRCLSRRTAPPLGRIPLRPTMHCCQSALAVPVVSGNGRGCSTPTRAAGRTRSGSIRSTRILQLPARPLAGSAGALLRTPVLYSCPYFITKLTAGKDGFL